MHKDLTFKLVQRFNAILQLEKDLDFKKSEWARDLLAACKTESAFVQWFEMHLSLGLVRAKEFLARAAAASIVTDADTWNRLGGFGQITRLEPLTAKQRVQVINTAKARFVQVRTAMSDLNLVPKGVVPTPTKPSTPPSRANATPTPNRGAARDATVLAQYIADFVGIELPRDIQALLDIYVPRRAKRAA